MCVIVTFSTKLRVTISIVSKLWSTSIENITRGGKGVVADK